MLSEQKLDDNNYLTNSDLDLENSAEIRNKIMELISQYAENVHSKKPFIPGKSSIPVSGRVFGGKEIQMLVSSSLDFFPDHGGRFQCALVRLFVPIRGICSQAYNLFYRKRR